MPHEYSVRIAALASSANYDVLLNRSDDLMAARLVLVGKPVSDRRPRGAFHPVDGRGWRVRTGGHAIRVIRHGAAAGECCGNGGEGRAEKNAHDELTDHRVPLRNEADRQRRAI